MQRTAPAPFDKSLKDHYKLTDDDIKEAQDWWENLPDHYKAGASIWTLLALYAQRVEDVQRIGSFTK